MSIKTLRKRIALVAVSALGVGLLSVTSANAAAPTTGRLIGVDYDTSQVCAMYDTDGNLVTADTTTSAGTDQGGFSVVMPVGGTITVLEGSNSNADNYYVVTGPLSWDNLQPADTAETITTTAAGQIAVLASDAGDLTMFRAVAAGSATITAVGTDKNNAPDADDRISITIVASCATSTIDLTESFIATTTASDSNDPTSNVDTATVATAGQSLYIGIVANNSYGSAIPSGSWAATATNGALLSFGANVNSAPSAGTASIATATDSSEVVVRVSPKTSGVAQTTTVTVSYNGVTVTTKNLTFLGEATKINVLGVYSGRLGSTGVFVYNLTDAAGNVVPGAVSLDSTTATQRVPSFVAAASAGKDATLAPADPATSALTTIFGSTTNGIRAYNCTASAGTGSSALTIQHTNAVTGDVLTATVTAKCAGGIDKYTVAMDKASYALGEIATMTITATDSTGAAVSDFTAVGSGAEVSAGGMELIGTVSTTGDVFVGGVRTYKFKVTTAGTFSAAAVIAGSTTKSATASYTVKSDGAVSNAEVLAAIVKLIASINKQIKALQKSLKR